MSKITKNSIKNYFGVNLKESKHSNNRNEVASTLNNINKCDETIE